MNEVNEESLKRMQENGVNYVELDTVPFRLKGESKQAEI